MGKGIYKHKPLSEEHKRKIGLSSKGRKASPVTKKKMSVWQKGIYRTSKPSYGTLHWRVVQLYGKAKQCTNYMCAGQCRTFDWANVSGEYLNTEDFIELCRTCHIAFDKAKGSKFGRKKTI